MIRTIVQDLVIHRSKHVVTQDDYHKRFTLWSTASEFLFLYTKGARVWISHPVEVWESAEIIESYDGKSLTVLTESGEKHVLKVEKAEELPPLRNPDILIGENDLTSLSYLHEPAVLYNLLVRFCHKYSIYTYCGIVLVAINPYQELPIYGNDTIWAYRGRPMGELDPHIFAIAEEAYNRMESEKKDQSIIVSGESGAGKTVSAKYVMRYFATVSGSSKETQIEKKVLASSPIMEAIGNAKTTRNDNSSRFGKFIELQFNKYYQIVGASMRTYLLEKSRVVFQAPEERNYHIFYQLCAARDQYPELNLDAAKDYQYLSSECVIPGVDDEKCFQDTKHALDTLGFDELDKWDIFCILSGILFLGNIKISENSRGAHGDSEASYIKDDDTHLVKIAELLKLNSKDLRKWLCHRRITSMKETFDKPMNADEARGARDALAKYMYAELFSWIVKMINRALETSNEKHRFIGVLDIYGFETFEINSFEQFCINYANEKLQQQFNLHVFKLDQEEYLKEDLEWKFIDFYDNQPCIDLIETRLGILDLLDEECRMPKGTDDSWSEKLYAKCSKWQHFAKPRFGTSSFIIKHFADSVEYQTFGFLDKNKDTVIEEQVIVLKESGNKLLRKLFTSENNNKLNVAQHAATIGHSNKTRVSLASSKQISATSPASKQHKKTVGSQFRDSLNALMSTLNATTPHYIRCIKPNDLKQAFVYNPQRAVQQLRACGVLETIRISAAGFPSRILYTEFHSRYKVLCKLNQRRNVHESCQFILNTFIKDEDKFKYGKTKIFFRAGQVAYLERLRSDKMKKCCILIQKTVRGYLTRKHYLTILNSVKLLQRFSRGYLARRRVYHIRRHRASIVLQKNVRRWMQYRKYQQIKSSVVKIQTYGRAFLAKRKYQNLKQKKAATIIQAAVRAWLQRKKYIKKKESIVKCQCAVRRYLARKRFKQLKREARSVEHMKKLNKGLENKIISLQQKINDLQKEMTPLRNVSQELVEVRAKLEALKSVEKELKIAQSQLAERDVELNNLVNLLQEERYAKEQLIALKEKELESYEKRCEELKREKELLVKDIENVKESVSESKVNVEEMIRAKIEHEKLILLREQDQDRDAYQKLLTERNILEARVEALEKELTGQGHGHHRSLSDASTISIQDNSRGSPDGTASVNNTESNDISLLLKLHKKLKSLEFEKDKLTKQIDNTERLISGSQYNDRARDSFKIQELEIENEKLRRNSEKLRKAVADSNADAGTNELLNQFREMENELIRRREECSQLRNVLVNNTEGLKSLARSNYSPEADFDSINEDGELVLAFEAQKKINRQLEEESQREKTLWQKEREAFREEIERLKADNERQQQLLSTNLSKTPQSQVEAYLTSEINRIVAENLEYRDKYDVLQKEYRNIKKQLQNYLEECNNNTIVETNDVNTSVIANIVNSELPSVRKKERDYMGMFEFSQNDIPTILKVLINDLKPTIAMELLPGLPAYITFMCIRHTDFVNDDAKVRALLCGFINNVKKVVKRRHEVETSILWLSNTLRLLNCLKQYSGEVIFQEENTPTQNAQCLQNFDLYEYRQVLSDQAIYIYQIMLRTMQNSIQQLALMAILDYEAIPGLSGGKHLTRSLSVTTANSPIIPSPDALQKMLNNYYDLLCILGVDVQIIVQILEQLFYFICATIMNNMLLRKELCHWTKGMQIRYNLSHLEQWARDLNSENNNILEMLQPIIQAAQLLQARKTEADISTICDMCSKMTSNQIIKILNLYTPGDDYEERVTVHFIRKVEAKLKETRTTLEQSPLLMDTKFQFPVRFPFNPSNIRLEDIEIPEVINLPMLRKI